MMKIDINCDVGEGIGNEKELMPFISSCNISCGAHAGSIEVIDEVLEIAKQNRVKVGAHPSFPDRENFGRKEMDISDVALGESLKNQLILFKQRASKYYLFVHHVKPHGALYNLISRDKEKAQLVVNTIKEVYGKIPLYVPYRSVIEEVALINHLPIIYEAFADRNYNDDYTLVSRTNPYAILEDPEKIINHVTSILNGKVRTIHGKLITIKAQTLCVHGDNKNVLPILVQLNKFFNVRTI